MSHFVCRCSHRGMGGVLATMRRTTKPVKKNKMAQREMCVVVSPNHNENDDNVDGDDMTRIMWTNLNVSSSDCYLDLLLIRQAQSNYQ